MTTATIQPVLAANFAEVAGSIVAGAIAVGVFVFIAVMAFKGAGVVFGRVGTFVGGMFSDAFRLAGALLTAMVYVPLTLVCIVIGRWSAARHYGGALGQEFANAGRSLYRLTIGHLTRLFGVQAAVQGLEQRVPEVIAEAPGADLPKARVGQFDGYTIIGSLAGGGSGGKLYVAEPEEIKRAALERGGHGAVDQVVIKCFSLRDGSSLPQIVRESRALDAAKRLGLVLDHELTGERFFYVMRYVPGQSLSLVVQQLHAASPPSTPPGLDDRRLKTALGYVGDLLATLDTYHKGGLWHKDVKPDNIIVDGKSAHLVDFGLITPLRSAMTLTTHGTEYFRDPEMVRLALRGVKVQDVDGTRFDIYAAGAVLYAVIENSFPAHGVLSQVSQRCPEAVKWIIRRAMTDYDKRYATPGQMLADLRLVMEASDPMAVKPGHLPSMKEGAADPGYSVEAVALASMALAGQTNPPIAAGSGPTLPTGPAILTPETPGARRPGLRPKIRVTNWWTGKFETDGLEPAAAPAAAAQSARFTPRPRPVVPAGARASASEQLERARARAESARGRAQARLGARSIARQFKTSPNGGMFMAAGIFLAGLVAVGALVLTGVNTRARNIVSSRGGSAPSVEIVMPGGLAVNVAADSTQGAQTSIITDTGENSAPRPAAETPAVPAGPINANVLVMIDHTLSTPRDPEHTAQINEFCKTLTARGATVASESSAEDPKDRAAYDECRAQLELAVANTPIDLDSARAGVRGWLSKNSTFDVVIWISAQTGSDPSKTRPLHYAIFPRSDDTMDADEKARVLAASGQIQKVIVPDKAEASGRTTTKSKVVKTRK